MHGKFHGPVFHLIVAILVREDVLALRAPDGLEDDVRPVILDVRIMLGRLAEERVRLTARPLDATLGVHDEDGLRQAVHRIIHELVDIRDDALAIALEAHGAVAAALARKACEAEPEHERCRCEERIVRPEHDDEQQHHEELECQIDPCRQILGHALTSRQTAPQSANGSQRTCR